MTDAAGFDSFFREVYPRLVLLLMKIGASEADALDAAQEAMTDLLVALSTDRKIRDPRAYVYQAGRRGFIRRAVRARRDEPLEDSTSVPANSEPDMVIMEEERLRVVALMRRLPPAQREVAALHYDGLAISEIAQMTGKLENTVRSLLRHGRTRLKEVIQSESTEAPGAG